MKRGSFNKIYKIGKLVVKIDADKDKFSNLIMKEMDNKKYIKYSKDLNMCGIKTSKIYFYTTFPKTILIEKNIKGKTLQEIMNDENVSVKNKLILIKKLLLIYKQTEKSNVCIDCNLKNFILNNNELIYIDFVPSLYKNKIKTISNEELKEYKDLYINKNKQLTSILNYILKALLYLPKDELKLVRDEIIDNMKFLFEFNIDKDNSVLFKKNILLERYISEDMSEEEFNLEYQRINKR